MSKPKSDTARTGRTARKPFTTNLRVEPAGDDAWKATEPDSEKDLYGRGSTPPEAVEHYCQLLQGGRDE